MTVTKEPWGYVYNPSKDYDFYIGRKRSGESRMRLKRVSWNVAPGLEENEDAGRDRDIMTSWAVSGSLETYAFNKLPMLEDLHKRQVYYYDPIEDVLYMDNHLEIKIYRWQNGVNGVEESFYDLTTLSKIWFPNFTEQLQTRTASDVKLSFRGKARPYTDYAQQAEANRSTLLP